MSRPDTHARRARRWPLRIVQASPLPALALFLLVWFTLPSYLSSALLDTVSQQGGDGAMTPEMRASFVDDYATLAAATGVDLWGSDTSFETRAVESWRLMYDRGSEYVTTSTVTSLPFAATDPVFAPLVAWEEKSGATVWAWTVLAAPKPAVVASATMDAPSLAALEEQVLMIRQGNDPTVYQPTDVLDYLWTGGVGYGIRRPLDPQDYDTSTAFGGGSDDYYSSEFAIWAGGETWRAFVLRSGNAEEYSGPGGIPELEGVDPRSDGYAAMVAEIAKRDELNIWVLGPLRSQAVPLRVPEGPSLADATTLGASVWPDFYASNAGRGIAPIRELSAEQQRLAGGAAASMGVYSIFNSNVGFDVSYGPDELAPQSVAYLTVFDEMPGGAPTAADRVWLKWQRFVAGWFPWLVGGSLGLFALSLVASPVAFAFERRQVARERLAQEMARMQRDAHDKVYNRLSALSKRVSSAGEGAAGDAAASFSAIADDIRDTVSELQQILGSEVEHTDSTLTTLPLEAQVAAVCRAQAARLGVEVTCEVEPELPDAPAVLGWDLQCILEELITNAVRHGGASLVHATLLTAGGSEGALELTVTDDGRGSSVLTTADAPEGSTGLRGIERRLTAHAGTIRIAAGDSGTVVVVTAKSA